MPTASRADQKSFGFGAPSAGWPVFDKNGKRIVPLRVYLAGPMRGYAKHNFPAFDRARDQLQDKGHMVISPADLDREVGILEDTDEVSPKLLAEMARRDYTAILAVDAIVLLPGWGNSRGARAEARFGLDIGIKFFELGARHGLTPVSNSYVEQYAGRGF